VALASRRDLPSRRDLLSWIALMAGRAGTLLVMVEEAGTLAAGTLLAWREEPAWKEARQKLPAFHLMAAWTEVRQKLLASHPEAAWMALPLVAAWMAMPPLVAAWMALPLVAAWIALPLVAAWRTAAAWMESRQMVPVVLYSAAA